MLDWLEAHLLSCGYKQLLGIDCPGCGFQRAFIALLRGQFLLSLQLFPALVPYLFTLVFSVLHLTFKFKQGARVILVLVVSTTLLMLVSYLFRMS